MFYVGMLEGSILRTNGLPLGARSVKQIVILFVCKKLNESHLMHHI